MRNFTRRLDIVPLADGQMQMELPYRTRTTHLTLRSGVSQRIDLPNDFVANRSLIEAVYITSSVDIALYVTQTNAEFFDTFLAFPFDTLGNEYVVPQIHTMAAMATTDNTSVRLIFSNGTLINVDLDELGVYTIFMHMNFEGYLTVLSNKPVSMFSGVYCFFTEPCGFATIQQNPRNTWDTQFIIPFTTFDMLDIYKFTPNITYDCFGFLENSMCDWDTFITNVSLSSQTSTLILEQRPLQVYMYYGGFIISLLNIPGVTQFLNDYTFMIPDIYSDYNNIIFITVLTSQINRIRFDDDTPLPDREIAVPDPFNQFSVLLFERVETGYHRLYDIDSEPFGLLCVGMAESKIYSYPVENEIYSYLAENDMYSYPAGLSFNTGESNEPFILSPCPTG